ncbi:MAG: hypothetical protein M0Q49_11250 [Porticoccaceae bacterium]|nr:hypothetical protein [Porticoccaceae bacterium]
MTEVATVYLEPAEWADLVSPYLTEGRKTESWEIVSIEVTGKTLKAVVRMTSVYRSATDGGQFHLSIFTTLEFLTQLWIIYAHVWAGEKKKTREGWMVESATHNIKAIRDPEHIDVEMEAASMRKVGGALYSVAKFRVTDRLGGLCTVRLKGLMP